ncbi:MAG TPA: kelch repeat-containing protein [Candidatus Limnocylindria bacterium]
MTEAMRALGATIGRVLLLALIPVSVGILVTGYVIESRTRPLAVAPAPSEGAGREPETSPVARATPTHEPVPTPHPALRTGAAWITADRAVIAVGGTGPGGLLLSSVTKFDAAVWTDLPPLPQYRIGAAGVELSDGTILVVGGEHEREPTDTTFILRPGAASWIEGQPIPVPQARMAAAAVGQRTFVFGGSSPGHERDLLIHDPDTDEWTLGTPLPTPVTHGTAIALDGLVYLFGGLGEDGEPTSAAHRYDPATGAWETLASIPASMEAPPAVGVDGRIWLTTPIVDPDGGASRLAVYDPAAERWQLAAIGDATRFFRPPAAALALADSRILLLGGGGSLTIQIIPTEGVELVDA